MRNYLCAQKSGRKFVAHVFRLFFFFWENYILLVISVQPHDYYAIYFFFVTFVEYFLLFSF